MFTMICTLLWYWMSRQVSPVWYMGQQALLVKHSNVSKTGIVFHPAKVVFPVNNLIDCFNISFVFLPALLLVGYSGDGTSFQSQSLLPSLAYHDL